MRSSRDSCLKHVGSGILGGATLGEWWRLLRENGFQVAPRYWPRAHYITALSLLNTLVGRWEDHRYGEAIERTVVPPPLFVLGVWRSGTSHLQNLLSQDRRFAYPSMYEVLQPHTFLSGGRFGARAMNRIVPRTRMMDGMKQGAHEPQEEEIALAGRGLSSMLALVFPRNGERYRRYATLQSASADEIANWQAAYVQFVRKLTLRNGRPLILKSPANTGRIRLLLEMFPGAKFVNVHRHPYEIFKSVRHSWNATAPWWRLQVDPIDENLILRDYAELYDAYFDQRGLIPAGDLCEVAFSSLEHEPLETLARIYECLSLPDFADVRPALGQYVDSIAGYRRNRYEDLSVSTRDLLARVWGQPFREWHYRP